MYTNYGVVLSNYMYSLAIIDFKHTQRSYLTETKTSEQGNIFSANPPGSGSSANTELSSTSCQIPTPCDSSSSYYRRKFIFEGYNYIHSKSKKKPTPKQDNISAKTSVGNESLGALDGKSELSQMLENDQREVKIQEQNLKELKKK